MDFRFTDEQEGFRTEVQDFIAEHAPEGRFRSGDEELNAAAHAQTLEFQRRRVRTWGRCG